MPFNYHWLSDYRCSSKYIILCSTAERNSYRFAMTWGWVSDEVIFGWTTELHLFKGVMNCLFYYFCTVLWGPLIMLSRFLHKKKHNLEVISYFLSCFDPAPFEQAWRIVDSEVNSHCYDWLTVVCLIAYILHRWKLLWFSLKVHTYSVHINISVIIDLHTYSLVCCDITVRSNIVCTALSFSFSLSEKPCL